MRLRLTKVDEFQFLTCFKHQLWGSKAARFKDWKVGDYLVFIVDKAVAGLAKISGETFVSQQRIWDNGIFPHRIPIKFVHVMLSENRPPILGQIREALTSAWGHKYGWGILNQQLISDKSAETIVNSVISRQNDLVRIQSHLDEYIFEAKQLRETATKIKRKAGRPKKADFKPRFEEIKTTSKQEESTHSRAQSALIKLGKITGCTVWIASNDQNRQYKGKRLGDGCLEKLPNLGLNKEATNRISLIDAIWIRQNSPICAFEIEATTSIYSGLLRMSDLLSVVPALNVKLFIVAPRERQEKVMAELARPTFQKIGLSEFCRFIAIEELDSLLSKVGDLEGHIHPSIIDRIAIELDEELESSLE